MSIIQSVVTSVVVYLCSLAIRKGIDWDRIYAPYSARTTFKEIKQKWPWCKGRQLPRNDSIHSPTAWNKRESRKYQYVPLISSREIRLLKVFCIGSPKQFTCELVSVSLDNLPMQYLAISYTWGEPAVYSEVLLGDNRFLGITKAVSIILDTMFDQGESMHIWIDSLCINQSDKREKSRQVRLMAEIYAKALQVVICLGEASPESDLAMDFVDPLRHAILAARRDKAPFSPELLFKKGGFDLSSPSWVALGKLFRRPWFGRIWVVQEVVVASDPVFICGNRALRWGTLVYVATRLFQHAIAHLLGHNPDDPLTALSAPEGVNRLPAVAEARAMKQEHESESFQDTLIGMYSYHATDPRDKIYALLGIATDTEDVMLNPDYEASVEEVYARTARYLLQRDASIVILHKAGTGYPRKRERLPSWVPQWEWNSVEEDCLCFGGMHKWSKYKAAGDSIPKVRSLGPNILAFHGVVVDEVRDISSVQIQPTFDWQVVVSTCRDAASLAWLKEHETLMTHIRSAKADVSASYPGTTYELKEAYWRTLVANSSLDRPAALEYGDYFDLWKRGLQSRNVETTQSYDVRSMQDVRMFCHAYFAATKNRRFFTTRDRRIGLTSAGTCPGDKICILLGGVTPFIIRQNANASPNHGTHLWTLISEAYVHGLMDGEGLDMGEVEEIGLI